MVGKLKEKLEACNARMEKLVADLKKEQAKYEVIEELIRECEAEEALPAPEAPLV